MTKIIVKVGNKTASRFSHCKVFRAIMASELNKLTSENNDCHIVVIENILGDEQDTTREFIKNFTKNKENTVIFYIPDNDDITSGIADEFDFEIYLAREQVYKAIYDKYTVNVSPYLEDRKKYNSISSESDIDSLGLSSFDINTGFDLDGTSEKIKSQNEVKEMVEVKTDLTSEKQLEEVGDAPESDITESAKYNELADKYYSLKIKFNDLKADYDTAVNDIKTITESANEYKKQAECAIELRDETIKRFDEIMKNNEIIEDPIPLTEYDSLKKEVENLRIKKEQLEIAVRALNTDVNNANAKVAEIKEKREADKQKLTEERQLREQAELESKSATAVVEEKDATIDDLQGQVERLQSDIEGFAGKMLELENALANKNAELAASKAKNELYNEEAKKALEEERDKAIEAIKAEKAGMERVKDAKISELTSQIENAKKQFNEEKESIEKAKNAEISELNIKLENAEKQFSTEKQAIVSEKDTKITELNDKISKVVDKCIAEKKAVIEEKDLQISALQIQLSEKDTEIRTTKELLTAEIAKSGVLQGRLTSLGSTEQDLVKAKEEAASYKTKYEAEQSNVSDLNLQIAKLNGTITQLNSSLGNSSKELAEQTRNAEMSTSALEQEKAALQEEKRQLESKNEILQKQLDSKTEQYDSLLSTSQDTNSKATALVAAVKKLTNENTSLKEQLGVSKKTVEDKDNDINGLNQRVTQLNTQVRQMKEALNAISSTNSVDVTLGSIQRSMYSGSAHIITVFGTGGCGTTTTAMSLANYVGSSANVLFIDFDIVSPTADAWFKVPPMIKDSFCSILDSKKRSGLGIFYELGSDLFEKNLSKIIQHCEMSKGSKGGHVDYISGVYYRVDEGKIINADYAQLLNLLGNKYEYIIIDAGRIGNSRINDELLKILVAISEKNIIVSKNDVFDIRMLMIKLNDNKFDTSNLRLLVNRCKTNNGRPVDIDTSSKKILGAMNIPYALMPFDTETFDSFGTFYATRVLYDTFMTFINTIVYR